MKGQSAPAPDVKPGNQMQGAVSNTNTNAGPNKTISVNQRNDVPEANTIGSKAFMRSGTGVYNNIKEMRASRHHRHHHRRHHKHHKNANQQEHAARHHKI
jgi:hypothetical protein